MKIVPLMLLLVGSCLAAGAPTKHSSNPKVINGSGCVEKAAENSCRMVIDSQTGELYNLLFSAKTPKPGTAIQFKGTQHQGATACPQGKRVNVSKWKKEKGIKCPPPAIAQVNH
ncbi:MAG TPA: hypothetical protein VMU45_12010 [Candidatus Eisenbacteria bacterium]|nr:hypothetical protein [Candidatus Eisenbacteria bacterium]